jgi:hypothetical protein
MQLYARQRLVRFGVEWLILAGVAVALISMLLARERFPGPTWLRTDAEFDAYYAQQEAWVADFNANRFDARFMPRGELGMLGGQFHIPPTHLAEAVAAANTVVLGSVQSISYVGSGFADYTLAVDEFLKGDPEDGTRAIRFRGLPAIDPARQADGSFVSGLGRAVGPEVFVGDRIVMLLDWVTLQDGSVRYQAEYYGSFLKLELGRVIAPDFSFPDQLNGLTLQELRARIRGATAN